MCRGPEVRRFMDMFLLFVVIFLSVLIGVGLSALALSLLFRLVLRLSKGAAARQVATAPTIPQDTPVR
jgi:NO-binding membrane sensor protein with MHYT domain